MVVNSEKLLQVSEERRGLRRRNKTIINPDHGSISVLDNKTNRTDEKTYGTYSTTPARKRSKLKNEDDQNLFQVLPIHYDSDSDELIFEARPRPSPPPFRDKSVNLESDSDNNDDETGEIILPGSNVMSEDSDSGTI